MLMPPPDYTPDIANLGQGSPHISGVTPMADGYGPHPSLAPLADCPDHRDLGLYTHFLTNGDAVTFMGTNSGIVTINPADGSDRPQPVWTERHPLSRRWSFCSYRDLCFAINDSSRLLMWKPATRHFEAVKNSDKMVYKDLYNQPLPADGVPRGSYCYMSSGVLFICSGNVVYWSAPDNPTYWTMGQNGAGFLVLPQAEVLFLSPDYSPLAICDRGIYMLNRQGDGYGYTPVDTARGGLSAFSCCHADGVTCWIDREGFYSCSGGVVTPLGYQQIDNTFREDRLHLDWVAVGDPCRNVIRFINERYSLLFSYRLQKWVLSYSHKGRSASVAPRSRPANTAQDHIDHNQPADMLGVRGACLMVYAQSASQGGCHILTDTGPAEQAVIHHETTGATDAGCVNIDRVFLAGDVSNAAITLQTSLDTNFRRALVTMSQHNQPATNGAAYFLARARYFSASVTIGAGECWTRYQGIDVATTPSGTV